MKYLFLLLPIALIAYAQDDCENKKKNEISCDIYKSKNNPIQALENSYDPLIDSDTICINNPCVIINGDPQYPWLNAEGDKSKKEVSKSQLKKYFEAINNFGLNHNEMFLGTIINGDITAYGHDWQIDTMKQLFNILKQPYWFGLGNHDIENLDCYADQCYQNSLDFLIENVFEKRDNILASDYKVNEFNDFPTINISYQGSFAYTFELADIVFIQMNNYDNYALETEPVYNALTARKIDINIFPSTEWVKIQMESARKRDKSIILLSHKDYISNYVLGHSIYNKASAHFFGHLHSKSKYVPTYNCGQLPGGTFYSGAAHLGNGIILEIDKTNKKLNAYGFTESNLKYVNLLKTVEMK